LNLEREIKQKLEQARDETLSSSPETFPTAVARYRVLKELVVYIEEQHDAERKGEFVDAD
tara:strand:- start:88 stop:267 length:180 start_codon:yes stop_codon:yes gene_type:complete